MGGTPLPDGLLTASVTVRAWAGFDETLFLWSDLPREYDTFAEAAPIVFTQP